MQQKQELGTTSHTFTEKSGSNIQYDFNEERLRGLELRSQKLISGDFSGITDLISFEKEAVRQRNKILRIADKHGCGTVKEYVDSDIADNSEDFARLRSAISRPANKKRQSPYERPGFQRKPGVFDGLSTRQLFLGSAKFNSRPQFAPRFNLSSYRKPLQTQTANIVCHYCWLPGHFVRFCPYTKQFQYTEPTRPQSSALVPTSTANQQ
uniref:CCHC-type domain-containing protein n=1 Tax=Magallana gigas TaxID=29159 RepID=A0A8W8NW57_MAGGI